MKQETRPKVSSLLMSTKVTQRLASICAMRELHSEQSLWCISHQRREVEYEEEDSVGHQMTLEEK